MTNNKNIPQNQPKPIKKQNKPPISPLAISLILGGFFILLTFVVLIFPFNVEIAEYGFSQLFKFNIFIFIFIFGFLFSFIYGIIYILILGGKNSSVALKYITIIVGISLGSVMCVTSLVNPAVKIFANSVGYLILSSSLYGYIYPKTTAINNIFTLNPPDIYGKTDKSVLLTLFDVFNFNKLYEDISTNAENFNFKLNDNKNENNKKSFHRMVVLKHKIGILSWYYISSFTAVLISLKYLVDI
jgi:hypothetical protein